MDFVRLADINDSNQLTGSNGNNPIFVDSDNVISEIINMRIVQSNNLEQHAQSCLRSNKPGVPCSACWKCFRKNSFLGHPFKISNEIITFLNKRPLKQAASTLYSIQRNDDFSKTIDLLFPI